MASWNIYKFYTCLPLHVSSTFSIRKVLGESKRVPTNTTWTACTLLLHRHNNWLHDRENFNSSTFKASASLWSRQKQAIFHGDCHWGLFLWHVGRIWMTCVTVVYWQCPSSMDSALSLLARQIAFSFVLIYNHYFVLPAILVSCRNNVCEPYNM